MLIKPWAWEWCTFDLLNRNIMDLHWSLQLHRLLLLDESWVAFELKTVELINIWSHLFLHLKKFIFNFLSTHSPIFLFEDCFTITRSLISEPMVAYHSLLGKRKHVKACDRRQMFALPLSRRVSASKGCLCAAQIHWHQVTKKKKLQQKHESVFFLYLCLSLSQTYTNTLH